MYCQTFVLYFVLSMLVLLVVVQPSWLVECLLTTFTNVFSHDSFDYCLFLMFVHSVYILLAFLQYGKINVV